MVLGILEFLRLAEVVTADTDGTGIGVNAEPDGHNMGLAALADGGESTKWLIAQILELVFGEGAHGVTLHVPS